MPVIWGLDLRDIQFWKFKHAYMFNRMYHLRRTKMIVYQLAMILTVCSESVGTAALSDYIQQQDRIQIANHASGVHNDDFVGIASYNIFIGIAVATIFGAAFFFDLFFPERRESKAVRLAWKISAVVITFATLADAIALTVIVVTHREYITGVSPETAAQLFQQFPHPNPIYKRYSYCVASVVLLWLGLVATIASTFILFASQAHDDEYGPKTAHYRQEEEKGVPHDRYGNALKGSESNVSNDSSV